MSQQQLTKTALILLAGGNSSRMGYPKAFFEIAGKSFTELIARAYSGYVDEMVLVLNSRFCQSRWIQSLARLPENMRYVINSQPQLDRIHSLQLGAGAIKDQRAFVHNIDQPFISREVIHKLLDADSDDEIIIPSYKNKSGHPVLINNHVIDRLRIGGIANVTLKEFYSGFRTRYIGVNDSSILCNVNTREDLIRQLQQTTV